MFLQFKAFVKDGIEIFSFDARLLLAAIREKSTRKKLYDNKRIGETVGIQGDDVPCRKNFNTETIVMEIDSNAEDAVGCSSTLYSAATAMNLQLTLLLQSLQMIQIDQVLSPSFVE